MSTKPSVIKDLECFKYFVMNRWLHNLDPLLLYIMWQFISTVLIKQSLLSVLSAWLFWLYGLWFTSMTM